MKTIKLTILLFSLAPLPLAMAAETNIDIINNTAQLNDDNNKKIITVLKKDNQGISHIRYNEFNVGNDGVIFDNKIGSGTIINEVISDSISELNGEINITGKKSRFMLINPNGIVCASSCNFRNTTQTNLIVGQAMLSDGKKAGRYADSTSALIIRNSTKKIASKLILNSKNIYITNSDFTADSLMFTNIYNHLNGSPSKNKITIDKDSKIRAKNIKFSTMDTDITNYGFIGGNINGMVINSGLNNPGTLSGKTLSLKFSGSGGITGDGRVAFDNHDL
ncbi:filamentous hemagglutinin N-terminal domain-containing protein [Morganella morganii]|nr:filamentous hemagglutinin N-terminal domain-containing protein [Morganella morganii]MEA1625185.1 filamentous hemagglutinin N-terminal domain-containing protein [Salmonella enterica]AUU01598.1 filamentous hemagglutinin N-terminal domain-containing protein [Morganella morganii]AVD59739.1 filamentous hemagglutinin N-terminal domain-containing protein [Morganella morganii]EKW8499356.1 filamentous hemagglutinin N-terminal domain-containing protein [Morganella morganii]ELA7730639.1 filamentous he